MAAASPLAIRDGIGLAMPLAEAKSLLKRNPGGNPSKTGTSNRKPSENNTGLQRPLETAAFHIFEHDPQADLEALEQLADSLEAFSPIVGLEPIEPDQPQTGARPSSIFLDVTGLAHLFGDEYQLARQLYQHCDRLGYLPRIAIANTVGAAGEELDFYVAAVTAVLVSRLPAAPQSLPMALLRIPSPGRPNTS